MVSFPGLALEYLDKDGWLKYTKIIVNR